MKIDVQFLQKRSDGRYRYRRVVPKELQPIIGKNNILIALGRDEAKALRMYGKANAEAEKLLSAATAKLALPPRPVEDMTPLEYFRLGQQEIKAVGLMGDDEETIARRDIIADQIAAHYPVDEEGYPIGIGPNTSAILKALTYGDRQKQPDPTLEDVRRLYLKERIAPDNDAKKLELERVFRLVREALGSDRPLKSLRRADAKDVRDHMLEGRKPASVDRYLNVVRAAINHALREYDLVGTIANPFLHLEAVRKDKAEPDRDKRRPFTDKELATTTARIVSMARPDLQRIWRMLAGTGCRLAEIAGLRVSDLHLDHTIPYISVEWHDDRRIKTHVSKRVVPLLGDALAAAKEAAQDAKGETLLFPAYGRKGGPDAASAALGKHVRACVTDTKVTTHSLRHRMKDRLRAAGVSKQDQDMILGHSSGGDGEDYGGDIEVQIGVAERALKASTTTPKFQS